MSPIYNGYCRFCQRLTARPKRQEEWEQTPSPHPCLLQSFEISPNHTLQLFSFLLPYRSLSLFCFKRKAQIFQSVSFLFLSFIIPLHLSFSFHVILGRNSARGLRPHRSSHHPSHRLREKCGHSNKLRDLAARNHEMMSSLVRCVDIPGHKTHSSPLCGYM